MRIRILGAAAGGGLPQWNCRCPNCLAARAGSPDVPPLTQSSLAVSGEGASWFLLNVSPDIRKQIQDSPALSGDVADGVRGTGIAGCVMTDAEIDHTTGLLLLREGCTFPIYAPALIRDWLHEYYPIGPILSHFAERPWRELALDAEIELCDAEGRGSGLFIRAFDLDPHPPRFTAGHEGSLEGSVVGLEIRDAATGGKMVYAPGVEKIAPALERATEGADAIYLDGTFWTERELIDLGLSEQTATEIGHMWVAGEGGSLEWIGGLDVRHRTYVHINNTNPMLNRAGAECAEVEARGVSVGRDGDEIEI